jgi:hypothetical protein
VVRDPIGRLPVFVIDRVELTDQRQRRLLVDVPARTPYLLVRLPQELHDRAASMPARDATRHPPLGARQAAFSYPEDARIGALAAIGPGSEGFQAEVNARFLAGRRQGLGGQVGT